MTPFLNRTWKCTWILLPLLVIAWQAAPEWPARAAMLDSPWRDIWYPAAELWRKVHPDTTLPKSPAASAVVSSSPSVPAPETLTSQTTTAMAPSKPLTPPQNAQSTPVTEPEHAIPSKVLMLGDSLMGEVAAGMRMGLPKSIEIIDRHKSSTGLANQGYYDWPGVAKDATLQTQPSNVVIHMGGNDAQDIHQDGRWVRFGSEDWKHIYIQRALLMINNIRLVDEHANIVWVGLPAMQSDTFNAKMKILEAIQEEAALEAHVPYVDSQDVIGHTFSKEGSDGKGHRKLWRAPDGIHYSREGGRLIAKEVALLPENQWPWND